MKKALIAVLLLALFSCKSAERDNKKEINICFNGYLEALSTNNGVKAIKYVDSRTIHWYEALYSKVMKYDSASLANEPFFDQMMALMMRSIIPADSLEKMNGEELFVQAVNMGLVDKEQMNGAKLDEIVLNGESAKAGFISYKGEKIPPMLPFYLEKDKWKISLSDIMGSVNETMENELSKKGITMEALVAYACEEVNGKTPPDDIWTPINARKKNQ